MTIYIYKSMSSDVMVFVTIDDGRIGGILTVFKPAKGFMFVCSSQNATTNGVVLSYKT